MSGTRVLRHLAASLAAGMLYLGYTGPVLAQATTADQDARMRILQQRVEWLTLSRRLRRKRSTNLSRLYTREHGKRFDPRLIVGDPVDDLVAVAAELLGSHVRTHPGSLPQPARLPPVVPPVGFEPTLDGF